MSSETDTPRARREAHDDRSLRGGGEVERLLDGFQQDPLHALDLVAECAANTQMQAAASSVAVVQVIADRLRDALDRERTGGAEDRDLPPPWGEGVKGPGMTEEDFMRMPGVSDAPQEEAGGEALTWHEAINLARNLEQVDGHDFDPVVAKDYAEKLRVLADRLRRSEGGESDG